MRRYWPSTLLLAVFAGLAIVFPALNAVAQADKHANKKKFDFAVIGDTGYNPAEQQVFDVLVSEIGQNRVEFVMHVGDMKGTNIVQPCTDSVFTTIRDQMNASAHPFIYTPGDNEWVDCPVSGPPGSIAEERLASIRNIFFPGVGSEPLFSLGQRRMLLNSQSAVPEHATFRENTRWTFGEIMFVMVNVPDTDNQGTTRCLEFDAANACVRTGIDDSEWVARTAANVAWLNEAFDEAIAKDMKGIVVGTHANFIGYFLPTRFLLSSPRYKAVLEALKSGARRFGGQVLLVHGDTHTPRIDQPYNGNQSPEVAPNTSAMLLAPDVIQNLTRVEVYGSTQATRFGVAPQSWLRVSVNPSTASVFTIFKGEPDTRDEHDDDD